MTKNDKSLTPTQTPIVKISATEEWLEKESRVQMQVLTEFKTPRRKFGVTFVGCTFFPLTYHLFDDQGRLIGATKSRGRFVLAYCPFYFGEQVYSSPVNSEEGGSSDTVPDDYLGFEAYEERHYELAARRCLEWRDRNIQAGQDVRLLADDCLHEHHYDYLEPISPDEFNRSDVQSAPLRAHNQKGPEILTIDDVRLEQSLDAPFDAYALRDPDGTPIGYAQVRLGVFRVVAPAKPGDNIYGSISHGDYVIGPASPGRIVYRTVEGVTQGTFADAASKDRLLVEAVRAVRKRAVDLLDD